MKSQSYRRALRRRPVKLISKDVFIALVYNLKMCHVQVYINVCFKCNLLMKAVNPITPCDSDSKEPAGNAGNRVQCLGQEDPQGEGNGNPSSTCLGNPKDRDIVHGVTK